MLILDDQNCPSFSGSARYDNRFSADNITYSTQIVDDAAYICTVIRNEVHPKSNIFCKFKKKSSKSSLNMVI